MGVDFHKIYNLDAVWDKDELLRSNAKKSEFRGPIFENSYNELLKNLGWACGYQKILQKSYEKLRTKLCKTYDKLTTTLQVSYENVKFAASDVIRKSLSEVVIGRILWAKNNWQPEWRFPKNAFEKWLTIFLRKS